MRTALHVVTVALLLAGCKSSGESDLERQLGNAPPGNPGTPGECEPVQAAEANDETADFYQANVYPVMQNDCMDCHVSGGEASDTAYVLSGDAASDYDLVSEFTEREVAGYPYLVAKATALAGHTGGERFGLSSAEAQVLISFAALLKGGSPSEPPDDCPGIPGDGEFFTGVTLASNEETLSKAVMLMLGRRPSSAEFAAVADGSLAALQGTLRDAMTGPDFTRFLLIAANDQLLTNRFTARGTPLIDEASDLSYYRFDELDYPGIMPMPNFDVDHLYNEALATEPLALIAYIVNSDRDYREVLTAPYTVFNSLTYEFFDHARDGYVLLRDPSSGAPLPAPSDPDDWVPGVFAPGVGTGYYINDEETQPAARLQYPHTGVLTTVPWLGRWPNTETNRNRKRAKTVLRQFLGYDIELTASRPMDADALNDPNNPTYNRPACTSCHRQLDALAGTFQNFGFTGRFRLNDEFFRTDRDFLRGDALNTGYRTGTTDRCGEALGTGGYCEGDLWYADTFPTGFVFQGESTITEMPNDGRHVGRDGPHDNATLQWAAAQLVSDSRFASGTAKFWYEAVFNEKALNAPVEGDPNYDPKLRAYAAQQQLFNDVAEVFARDNGHGVYNAKDLLVALFSSPWFRSINAEGGEGREVELANVGMGALLTPEQLERKVRSVLGIDWRVQDQYFNLRQALTYTFNVMYGGIDSDTVNVRTRQINPLMFSVTKRMVSEISCETVYREFIKDRGDLENYEDPMLLNPPAQRRLFGDYAGETPDDEAAIKRVLVKLHRDLWNEQVEADSTEVQHSFELFQELWDYEQGSAEEMRCESNSYLTVVPREAGGNALPPEAMRVWRDMLSYFIFDFKFLHE